MARAAYTAEQKAAYLEVVADHGIAHAAQQTGIPKGTLSRWAKAAGIVTVSPERTANAVAQVQLNAIERRAKLADRLLEIAEAGAARTAEIIGDAKPRDLVGLWTRAIHDHLLLSGQATARVEHRDSVDAEIERLVREMADA